MQSPIEVADKEQARAVRSEILSTAAVLLAPYDNPSQATFEEVLDNACVLFRGASSRIKIKSKEASATA
jgi:hypothetical protein